MVTSPLKQHLITAAKFATSIAILTYLFNKASRDDQFTNVLNSEKNWTWIIIGLIACLMAHIIGFVRWRMMVRVINLPFSIFDAIRIGFIGIFFNLFAFGVIGGDTLRAFYVSREFPSRKSEAIASVVADRAIGLLSMFLVASIAYLLFDTSHLEITHAKKLAALQFVCTIVMVVTFVGLGLLVMMFVTPRLNKRVWFKRMSAIPAIGPILKKLISVISVYRNRPTAIVAAFAMSFALNACFAFSIYSIARGLFTTYPSLANHFVIEPIGMVSNAVPLPGGLGGMEFAVDFLYQAFGYENGVVVAFSFRFCLLLVSAIGAGAWFFNRSKVKRLIGV
jgi:uncharacterized protein (TIRG00374 family)